MIWTALYQKGCDEAFTIVGAPDEIHDHIITARRHGSEFAVLTAALWDEATDELDDEPVYVERTMFVDPAEVAAISPVRGSLHAKLTELAGR